MAQLLRHLACFLGLLFIGWLSGSAAVAQSGTATLAGTVQDSLSGRPVAYATVVVLANAPGAPALASGSTTEQGGFRFAQLPLGPCRLQISFVGYAPHSQAITLAAGATTLPPILLVPAAQQLAEAVVLGTKPTVEVGTDRLIYNAAQDVGNAGGTAQDVLRKTPLLAVDGTGTVTLRGSTNFKVLVDNHPSPTLAQNLAQTLKSIPAAHIQRIEVITTPAARDDGEGAAGIVNIVLKKEVYRNLNGHLGASGGNRTSELTAALGSKRGKLGLNLAAGVGRWQEPDQLDRQRLGFGPAGPDTLRQSGRRQNTGTWYNSTLSLDYDPAPHHSFALLGTLGGYQAQSQRDLVNRLTAPTAALNQLFTQATTEQNGSLRTELTGTYTRTFAQARRQWSALTQYAYNAGTFGYDADQYANSTVALTPTQARHRERSRGRTPSHEFTAQADAAQPLGDKQLLELGLKAIVRRTATQATVEGLTLGQAPNFAPLAGRNTDFEYAQQVQAAYASYSGAAGKKLTATLGARLERTALQADFQASGTTLAPQQYWSALPSGSLRYTINDTSSLRLAYSRRITRPSIDFLNPFVDRSNPQNLTYGNPTLAPELTDAYEASYSRAAGNTTMLLSGTVRHTGSAIEAVRLPTATAGVTAQTYANVAATTFYQLTIYGTAKPTQHWEVRGGPNVQYVVLLSPEMDLARRGFTAGLSVDSSYHFAHKLTAQASVSGALPAPLLQGQGSASLYYELGVKKELLGEKVDVALNLLNPFTSSFPNRSTLTTAFADERTEYRTYQQAFRFSLNYRFGQDAPAREHRRAEADDLKSK